MLRKETIVAHRNVRVDGQIEVRYDTFIFEDNELISGPSYHREVILPGQDVSDKDPMIQRIAAAEHTPAVIAAYVAARDARDAARR